MAIIAQYSAISLLAQIRVHVTCGLPAARVASVGRAVVLPLPHVICTGKAPVPERRELILLYDVR